MKTMGSTSYERSLGAFLGAAIGDAAGTYLEFKEGITDKDVERAMSLQGGGPYSLGPGQITDDTELAIALSDGMLRGAKASTRVTFPVDTVAQEYIKWLQSSPYDVSFTCRSAFGIYPGARAGNRMLDKAANGSRNAHSNANGALMRCVPICIYTARNLRETIDYAKKDAQLSHPHPICQNANIAYCAAVAHLLENPQDVQGALAKASSTALTVPGCGDIVRSWIASETLEDPTVDAGHVKHAFSHAFWHLRQGSTYEDALRDTIRRGGDTNTNATVVGGMMGAYHGMTGIPVSMAATVITDLSSRPRPQQYNPSRIPGLTKLLCSGMS